jgi:hypothetical protein
MGPSWGEMLYKEWQESTQLCDILQQCSEAKAQVERAGGLSRFGVSLNGGSRRNLTEAQSLVLDSFWWRTKLFIKVKKGAMKPGVTEWQGEGQTSPQNPRESSRYWRSRFQRNLTQWWHQLEYDFKVKQRWRSSSMRSKSEKRCAACNVLRIPRSVIMMKKLK